MQGKADDMLKYADTPVVRKPLPARPQLKADKVTLRQAIIAHFAKTLEYLAK
jgi:hypothetical protein